MKHKKTMWIDAELPVRVKISVWLDPDEESCGVDVHEVKITKKNKSEMEGLIESMDVFDDALVKLEEEVEREQEEDDKCCQSCGEVCCELIGDGERACCTCAGLYQVDACVLCTERQELED